MATIGYRRVSTEDQNFDRQDLVCDKLFEEKVSGGSKDRAALTDMLDWVREGDEVVVHSIDRLARNLRDLQDVIQTLTDKGVTVTFLTERLTFSGGEDPFTRLQLQMMGAFAEFEKNLIKRRQLEGIRKAKERGVYKGRVKSINDNMILTLHSGGTKVSDIARELGISRMSVYRALAAQGSSKDKAAA